jgi:hypothetical protein
MDPEHCQLTIDLVNYYEGLQAYLYLIKLIQNFVGVTVLQVMNPEHGAKQARHASAALHEHVTALRSPIELQQPHHGAY